MEIKDILSPGCTQCAAEDSSKKRILETIANIAHRALPQFSSDDILESLLNREKVGSTGIGNGIALPHGRLNDLDKVVGVLITCQSPISFDAIDNKPVDIFFALLVPAEQAQGHLQTLATIAGKLNDKDVLKKLRQAETNHDLYEAII
ncbi:PTS IIA-like nitrogen regulatory protein PtsN [Neptunicella marina]|uniref:PTS IIA-like nitrogen regulatory protein PtsN n=1 Tax=Neptunicella marina TaxID=2125989 RepID=A0A8J6ISW2_9ALTE|nr:PTS IIA-like nitrogen regulatory protein PtsN [Neptunicella marina]MBC3765242.1 PTS IIA-like nitrogen regulatory protein PtsN [Neptunicella marina]